MFHLLSFTGRWDPSFFATQPVPQQLGEQVEAMKQATCAAAQDRSQLRVAQAYDALNERSRAPEHKELLALLHDGTLLAEAIGSRRSLDVGVSHTEISQVYILVARREAISVRPCTIGHLPTSMTSAHELLRPTPATFFSSLLLRPRLQRSLVLVL